MELILNLAWLALVLAASAGIGVCAASEPDRRRVVLAAVSTACVLAVLFPIISMSDDMQANVVVIEKSFSVRKIILTAALQVAPAITAAFLFTISIVLIVLGTTTGDSFRIPSSPALPVFSLRGPPTVVC